MRTIKPAEHQICRCAQLQCAYLFMRNQKLTTRYLFLRRKKHNTSRTPNISTHNQQRPPLQLLMKVSFTIVSLKLNLNRIQLKGQRDSDLFGSFGVQTYIICTVSLSLSLRSILLRFSKECCLDLLTKEYSKCSWFLLYPNPRMHTHNLFTNCPICIGTFAIINHHLNSIYFKKN